MYPVEDHSNWMGFNPDAGLEIQTDLLPEKVQLKCVVLRQELAFSTINIAELL
jgi:hypothetical protein